MPQWPLWRHGVGTKSNVNVWGYLNNDVLLASCNPSATAFAKGAWAQIIASTEEEAHGFYLTLNLLATDLAGSFAVDIGAGAAGAEVVLFGDIVSRQAAYEYKLFTTFIPLRVPAGVRLAVRCSWSVAAEAARVVQAGIVPIYPSQAVIPPAQYVTQVGATGVAAGNAYDCAVIESYAPGAIVELSAATSGAARGIIIGYQQDPASGSGSGLLNLLVGAASAESIAQVVQFGAGRQSCMSPYIPLHLPAGTRLAIRPHGTVRGRVCAWLFH